jgi:hypothetical protein
MFFVIVQRQRPQRLCSWERFKMARTRAKFTAVDSSIIIKREAGAGAGNAFIYIPSYQTKRKRRKKWPSQFNRISLSRADRCPVSCMYSDYVFFIACGFRLKLPKNDFSAAAADDDSACRAEPERKIRKKSAEYIINIVPLNALNIWIKQMMTMIIFTKKSLSPSLFTLTFLISES